MSISVGLQKYKLSISVGVRGTEVLATTQTSDVNPGHGTNALLWGMTLEVEKNKYSALELRCNAITQASDVSPGHGTKALIWEMT